VNAGHDEFLEFTDGDVAAARLLRENLAKLAEQTDDDRLRRDIRATLAGSMDLRDLVRNPLLLEIVDRGVREFEEAWEQLTPEQRQTEIRAGRDRDERTRAD
jgi:hypothetical protein